MSCVVGMYHYIREVAGSAFPALHALSPAQFEQQLDLLTATRNVLDFETFEAALRGRAVVGDSVLLTFDDGVRDHYELMPRLLARKVQGVFFIAGDTLAPHPRVLNVHKVHLLVATLGAEALLTMLAGAVLGDDEAPRALESSPPELYRYDDTAARTVKRLLNYTMPIEDATAVLKMLFEEHIGPEETFAREFYLSADMVVEMSRAGMTFGFHTESHPVLSRLSVDEQRGELARGVRFVRELTGQESVPFCIPHGHRRSYTDQTLTLLDELGYAVAFSAVRSVAHLQTTARLDVPRLDTKDMPPFADVAGLQRSDTGPIGAGQVGV